MVESTSSPSRMLLKTVKTSDDKPQHDHDVLDTLDLAQDAFTAVGTPDSRASSTLEDVLATPKDHHSTLDDQDTLETPQHLTSQTAFPATILNPPQTPTRPRIYDASERSSPGSVMPSSPCPQHWGTPPHNASERLDTHTPVNPSFYTLDLQKVVEAISLIDKIILSLRGASVPDQASLGALEAARMDLYTNILESTARILDSNDSSAKFHAMGFPPEAYRAVRRAAEKFQKDPQGFNELSSRLASLQLASQSPDALGPSAA
ncbi:hypothetical protein BDN72DRAFT_861882 [Pluteus cervinus]|uniref:Uncharacterized protein n=1 Tax=Pluteus cervinus TaxID=181527 RepID=A0ACD3ADJ6_9AGAR|nr:hypothetical protein BDN72DRAFT_861882 [Pluteus cervinus]